jgi:carbon-monoxide dehydrogenase medium subunit
VTALVRLPDYARPTTVAEAAALAARPGAMLLAGGTDLMNELRLGVVRPSLLVDLGDIEELARLEVDGRVSIGAAVTVRALLASPAIRERFPVLVDAGTLLGGRQIQASATVGGNVCHASPAAELATPLVVLDATAVVEGAGGRRELPAAELWAGPRRTVLAADEVLVALHLPEPAAPTSAYQRMELRRSVDIALVSASVNLPLADGVVTGARVAVGAAAPTPLRVPAAERALDGVAPADAPRFAAAVAQASALCRDASSTIDDVRASAGYRRAMVAVTAGRAMHAAAARAA